MLQRDICIVNAIMGASGWDRFKEGGDPHFEAFRAWTRTRHWAGGIPERLMEYRRDADSASFRFDVGCPDHLASRLSFLDNELPQVGRRAGKRNAAQVG